MEFTSNMDDHNKRLEKAIRLALRTVGGQAERIAKETISDMEAVDTGFLRNSITFALSGEAPNISEYTDDAGEQQGEYGGEMPEDDDGQMSVYIGTNVFYGPYVEYGTYKMVARPFLSSSINGHADMYKQLFSDAFDAFM